VYDVDRVFLAVVDQAVGAERRHVRADARRQSKLAAVVAAAALVVERIRGGPEHAHEQLPRPGVRYVNRPLREHIVLAEGCQD